MAANASSIPIKRNINVKAIVLPIEHGSWGFVFEPLVAALVVAFTPPAIFVALLVVGAFLTRQPLKILLSDWKANRDLPQTAVARNFVLIYGAIFLLGFAGSLFFVKPFAFLPFLLILPLAAYQIYCDASRKSRELLPELTGAVAISSSAAVIALAAGWPQTAALALWAIFIARLIPSILYVRNRLRLEKGKEFSFALPFAANLAALCFIAALAFYGFASILTTLMFAILFGRAAVGLSGYRRRVKAMRIGVWEVAYGSLTAISVVLGYYLKV